MRNLSWPQFLDLLDADPDTAFADFYRFAFKMLSSTTPRPMRNLNQEDREDLIQEVIYHCVKNNFQVLRQYVDKGKPFAAWLYTITHNFCIDYLRSRSRNPYMKSIQEDINGPGLENVLSNRQNHSQNRPELMELIALVKKDLELVGEYCRLLLEMAADEFTPKEMALVLGIPKDQNKKISDDLRYCRKKLRSQLAKTGIDIESLLNT